MTGGTANQRTLAAYEQAADLYRSLAPPEPGPDIVAFLEEIVARIPSGQVLEVGSGPGIDARWLESRGLRVTRTDATAAFVEFMRADGLTAQHLNVVTDDLGGPYDAIYAGAVLLHLPTNDFASVLGKARAAARNLAFTVKEGDGEEWTTVRLGVPRWFRYWREAPLRAALEAAGWRVEILRHVQGRRDDWLQVLCL